MKFEFFNGKLYLTLFDRESKGVLNKILNKVTICPCLNYIKEEVESLGVMFSSEFNISLSSDKEYGFYELKTGNIIFMLSTVHQGEVDFNFNLLDLVRKK